MCRFILVRSKENMETAELLTAFAQMCEASRGPGGARQVDGWGIAWQEEGRWKEYRSLLPIWEDQLAFPSIPRARVWAAHARSAGFKEHQGIVSHNQPYTAGSLCFVFNGMVRGVSLPMKVEGEIGAQKFFALLRKQLERQDPLRALQWLDKTMRAHSRRLVGMNIGLIQGDRFYMLCEYGEHADYFGLNYAQTTDVTVVCSEKLAGYEWQTMGKGQVLEV